MIRHIWKSSARPAIIGIVAFEIAYLVYVLVCYDENGTPKVSYNPELALFYNQSSGRHRVWRYGPRSNENEILRKLEARLASASVKKIIVIWTPPFGVEAEKPVDRLQCGNCEVTYNRSKINNPNTGAIVHHFDSVKLSEMPMKRNPKHLHIFWTMESPSSMKRFHYTLEPEDLYGMNATMTYRIDADFLTNYHLKTPWHRLMGRDDSVYEEVRKQKSKLAIAVISDCDVTPGARARLALINQLANSNLKIETFGKCFSNRIPSDLLLSSISKYKFYFAFENSYHCKEYISEKYFKLALGHNTVPVVWGASKEDYSAISPPHSYIHIEDFESPQSLIDYLNFLDNNDEEYLKFFRWRTMKPEEAVPLYGRQQGFCAICRALYGINVDYRFNPRYNESAIPLFSNGTTKRTIPSLRNYFYGQENENCFWDIPV